ncbi:MAG TPA: Rrf2 family transcriptional regulator [Longimicrobiales bacterium]|nr:Rrf2 family transcriptional regulator [Longimicrobiales bacterium]
MPSQTAEHALRAVVYLADRDGERPLSADRLAQALGAPANYLSKTLHALARAGILRSTTGRRGGFSLARPADRIPLATVLAVFDEPPGERLCLLRDRACDGTSPCRVHPVWTRVRQARRAPLTGTTVGDLLRSGPCTPVA